VNVLNTLKIVPEVCRLFCATANPTEVILAETEQGRGIPGMLDGFSPKGAEDESDIKWRKDFLYGRRSKSGGPLTPNPSPPSTGERGERRFATGDDIRRIGCKL
jgi:hypothetical protein